MKYTPLLFDRESYLQEHTIYETKTLNDVEWEISEHNGDIESMAYELAYSRYRIAKLENILRRAHKQSLVIKEITTDGWT
jgi:hypothetical protein